MKNIKAYDNGNRTKDRYMVVFTDKPILTTGEPFYRAIGMSENPNSSRGFCMKAKVQLGKHLGKEVSFDSLPEEVKNIALGKTNRNNREDEILA